MERVFSVLRYDEEVLAKHSKGRVKIAFPQCAAFINGKVDVVAVIGDRHASDEELLLNGLLGVRIFPSDLGLPTLSGDAHHNAGSSYIQGYYDEKNDIIYLHLPSTTLAVAGLEESEIDALDRLTDDELEQWAVSNELSEMKAMLFAFLVSHVVLLVHERPRVDMRYVRLLDVLQRVKRANATLVKQYFASLKSAVSMVAGSFGDDILGRRQVPLVSFVFRQCHLSKPERTAVATTLSSQIKQLFGSVFDSTEMNESQLCHICTASPAHLLPSFSGMDQHPDGLINCLMNDLAPTPNKVETPAVTSLDPYHSFRVFVYASIAYTKAHVTSPTKKRKGKSVAISTKPATGQLTEFGSEVLPFLNPTSTICSVQCRSAITPARKAYHDRLPSMYTTREHEERLRRARAVFCSLAVGPGKTKALADLENEFAAHWADGHQQCDAISLLHTPCVRQKHRVEEDDTTEGPILLHASASTADGACNCGQVVLQKSDPFNVEETTAQAYFADCCRHLPTITPSISPEDWAIVLLIGEDYAYDQLEGFSSPGFAEQFRFLVPFVTGKVSGRTKKKQKKTGKSVSLNMQSDFPSLHQAASSDSSAAVDAMGAAIEREKATQARLKAAKQNSDHILVDEEEHEMHGGWVGYDYECPQGHRFLLPPSALRTVAANAKAMASGTKKPLPLKQKGGKGPLTVDVACHGQALLYANCRCRNKAVESDTTTGFARLQRVFLKVPAGSSMAINPVVKFVSVRDDGSPNITSFSCGPVELEKDSFVSLRLPPFFFDSNGKQAASTSTFHTTFELMGPAAAAV